MMKPFAGFPPGKSHTTLVPNPFFSDLLPIIDDLAELKLTLYCFWALQQQEGEFRYVLQREILQDSLFLSGIDDDPAAAKQQVVEALERATARGTLLHATVEGIAGPEDLYFMNTTRGRNALTAIEAGRFQLGDRDCPVALIVERPNIFTLYEQNIGPLTPMISEQLRDIEQEYPAAWFEEAIKLAVGANKRSLRYITAILTRWQTEGKDGGLTKQSNQADDKRYISGALADFIDY